MRICLVTRYFDYRNAGIGRVSCELRDRLIARGHDVVRISTDSESLVSYFKYTAIELRGLIPKDCDVYHAITPMEGIWLPKDRSVVTYLDLIPMTHPERAGAGIGTSRIKNWIGRQYFSWAAKRSAKAVGLVAISEATKQYMVDRLRAGGVQVIRLGISADLHPAAKTDHTLRIGYLGQLDRRKRVDLLINAFKQSWLDAELVIAGTGRDEYTLKELAGHDSRIEFAGFVPDDELCAFYNSLDVFVSPTWVEGYGLTIVEAMACGKPVVVLADAVIPEEIRSRCVIADNLVDILADREVIETLCEQADIEGNLLFARDHNWENCVAEYVALYQKVSGHSNGQEA